MKCPFCTAENTAVKDSRPAEDNTAVRRRRACEVCGGRFTTFERVQLRDIVVVKRDGKRALFDREKVAKSVTIALRKRAVGDESVEQLVSGIVRKLESSGETEVGSEDIGELVMEALKTVDPVGYVRYASVYKDFKDPSDFARFIESSALEEGSDEA
ncbi:MAG: transcriptional regulator NrdR [Henriciella sp.]|uniref:transcriptional regulator NrdR n=1 Tax=Henriciella sp. TaxID=1968823 RepID=UPI003C716A9C